MKKKIILTKDAILNAKDSEREFVPTPEWADPKASKEEKAATGVYMTVLTSADKDMMEKSMFEVDANGKPKEKDMTNFRAKLVVLSARDEDGNLLFSWGDQEMLAKKSSVVVNRLWTVAQRVNKMRKKDVEELVKNLK